MLGWIGKWSGSKGMAKVPNLLGLNRGQARQALQNAGFKFGNETEDVQSDQSLTDKVKNQGIPQDTLLEYESSVDYVLYAFSFVPYSFTPQTPYSFTPQTPYSFTPQTPYSFTPASYSFTPQTPYSFTPEAYSFTPYSFTPYSFTPYSFTPYSFTPQAVTCGECQNDGALIIIPVCDGEDSVEGFFQPQSQFCSDGSKIACPNVWTGTYGMLLEANSRSCGGSGYSFVPYSFTPYSFTPYSFTPYSFTPYSFTPQAYSFTPQSNGCPAPGEWGPWSACVNGTRTRTRTNYDDVPGCPPYIESETENCTTPYTFTPQTPYTFTPQTPYTFTPQAYSFTPFSFIPQSGVYTFTPETPYTFTPQAYSFTPFSFIPQTAYSFVPQTAYSFVPQTPYSFVPQSYSFTPAAFAFVPQFMS